MSQYQNITVLTGTRQQITNNAFSFSAGHPFLQLIMRGVERSYRPGCWACIGPEIFTKSLKEYDNSLRKDVAVVDMKRSYRSCLMSVQLKLFRILGIPWFMSRKLIDSRTPIRKPSGHFLTFVILLIKQDPQFNRCNGFRLSALRLDF